MNTPLRPALLLDRDGVINKEVHRLHDPRDLELLPGAARAIAEMNHLGVPVVVVTNQSGIGRGIYTEGQYQEVTDLMRRYLAAEGATLDGIYHCPHRPEDRCPCRKPQAGLLNRAAQDLGLALDRSVMVGDKLSDIEAARSVGCRAILVRTGYGGEVERELLQQGRSAEVEAIVDSLEAALPILRRLAP